MKLFSFAAVRCAGDSPGDSLPCSTGQVPAKGLEYRRTRRPTAVPHSTAHALP